MIGFISNVYPRVKKLSYYFSRTFSFMNIKFKKHAACKGKLKNCETIVYLEPSQTSTTEVFCQNSYPLKVTNYFRKKIPMVDDRLDSKYIYAFGKLSASDGRSTYLLFTNQNLIFLVLQTMYPHVG